MRALREDEYPSVDLAEGALLSHHTSSGEVMAQKESRLSTNIQAALRKKGYFCFKVHGGEHMMSGLPDIVVCAMGLFIGLETKRPETRKDTSARQRFVHEQIEYAGGVAAVVCSVKEALDVVEKHLKRVTVHKKP